MTFSSESNHFVSYTKLSQSLNSRVTLHHIFNQGHMHMIVFLVFFFCLEGKYTVRPQPAGEPKWEPLCPFLAPNFYPWNHAKLAFYDSVSIKTHLIHCFSEDRRPTFF